MFVLQKAFGIEAIISLVHKNHSKIMTINAFVSLRCMAVFIIDSSNGSNIGPYEHETSVLLPELPS